MAVHVRADWSRANQLALMAEVAAVRNLLERHAGHDKESLASGPEREVVSALDNLCSTFGLSSFERKALVMCAAIELDGTFASLCALAAGDPARAYPTFGLALAAFEDAHWNALTPHAPLRRWSLVNLGADVALTTAPLRIDENILHELAGVPELDARLRPLLGTVLTRDELAASQREPVERIAQLLRGHDRGPALVQLTGNDAAATRGVAAQAFANLGTSEIVIDARALPRDPGEIERVTQIWARETLLRGTGLYLDAHGLDETTESLPVVLFVENAPGPIVVGADRPLPFARRSAYTLSIGKPTRAEQRDLWLHVLGSESDAHGCADSLAGQFDFTGDRIRAVGDMTLAADVHATPDTGKGAAWAAACASARAGLDRIAQRLDGRAAADALVLPALQRDALRDIVAHARNRTQVYEGWGMGRAGVRGLGLSALFHGPSGSGKTLAAEAIGNELGVDVYRVDLSALMSKYIGETEKNLRCVFDAAEDGGAILLFDECDALFGKRGEVQYGHDRYANVEVSYLLQRVETYRGVAILTTNMRSAIDPAFLRRIRFIVAFPFPDYEQRLAIWQRAFAPGVPTENLDFTKTARLNVTGGNIRNIALHASFLAADAGEPVRMEHLLRAARTECLKIERAPSELEIGAWL
jgi:hypothetical protein